jgi:hypothetical protein
MKIITAAFVLLVFGNVIVFAQWNKDGERTADSSARKSVGGFGGHLIVVENPKAFIEEWQKPETPNITIVKSVDRGVLIGAFVLFAGCKTDAQKMCNSEVDYLVYKPDGTLYAERKNQPLWKDEPPPAPNIQLSNAILAIRFEKDDAPGEYKVKAKVSDLNAQISFELETSFRLN